MSARYQSKWSISKNARFLSGKLTSLIPIEGRVGNDSMGGTQGVMPAFRICGLDQFRDDSGGISKAAVLQANLLKLGGEDIGERDIPGELEVVAVFETQLFAAGENEGVVPVGVGGAVAAAVEESSVVEEGVAGFRSGGGVSHPG